MSARTAYIERLAGTRRAFLGTVAAVPLAACTTVTLPSDPFPHRGRVIDLGDLALMPGAWNASQFEGGGTLYAAVARVHDLAFRLRAQAGTLCGSTVAPLWGFVALNLSTLESLGLQDSAQALGIADQVRVFHVVEGSPAAIAGLRRGDAIVQVDGDSLPVGAAAIEAIGKRMSKGEPAMTLGVWREGTQHSLSVQPAVSCGIRPVLASNQQFFWDEQHLPIAEVGDPMLAFAIAYMGALGLQAGGKSVTVTPTAAEAANFSLSMLSLMLGLATLGGWSAKPIKPFDEGSAAGREAQARHELRLAASRAADKVALRMLYQAGFDLDDLFAQWRVYAEPVAGGEDPPRLHSLKEESVRLTGRSR